MTARYALYFVPTADHPLWAAGCAWLGRDPAGGSTNGRRSHRDAPRRYGFHATLKAPFALRDGVDASTVEAALSQFVADRAAFAMPALAVAMLSDFIALRPVDAGANAAGRPLRALADDCVRHFDTYRRPASAEELARRSAAASDASARACLDRWGYAHVFDRWRFHMTLSDSLPVTGGGEHDRMALLADAESHFAAALAMPLRCDGVALFVEPEPGADFRLARRFPFAR